MTSITPSSQDRAEIRSRRRTYVQMSRLEDLDPDCSNGHSEHPPAVIGVGDAPIIGFERQQRRPRTGQTNRVAVRTEPTEHRPDGRRERESRVLMEPVVERAG